jgi:hypothetical protein
VDPLIRQSDVRDVVGDDGRHDATDRGADTSLFARVNRNQKFDGRPFVPMGNFAIGYLVAWGGFSALATGSQWELEQLGTANKPKMTT